MRTDLQPTNHRVSGLVDVLDRVLDKGLAIAGDIKISLAEVELLTIRIRLIICSIDKAQEIGLDWWKHDRYLTGGARGAEREDLGKQLRQLERKVAALTAPRAPATGTRMVLVRQRTRLQNRFLATLAKYSVNPPDVRDLFERQGREWLEQHLSQLPPQTASATRQLLRQIEALDRQVKLLEERVPARRGRSGDPSRRRMTDGG